MLFGVAFALILVVSVVVSLSLGSARLPLGEVWQILLHRLSGGVFFQGEWPGADEAIILRVRLPRVVLAVLVGAALALAGAGFQGVLRNPLADPYTLGVASGSSVGAAFLMLFGLQGLIGQWTVPIVAFLMGMLTLVLVFLLAGSVGGKKGAQVETLILAGVVVQAFFGSLVSLMVSLANKVVNDIVFWLMGSLSMRGWNYSLVILPYLVLGLLVLIGFSRSLNLFALGEHQAEHMGVDVRRTKIIVLSVSTLLTAAAVSVSGVIGFVGLVVPHLVRLLTGPDYRRLIPLSALAGGTYVLWADSIARLALNPREIPLGVVTALIGAPFFAYLLRRQKKSVRS